MLNIRYVPTKDEFLRFVERMYVCKVSYPTRKADAPSYASYDDCMIPGWVVATRDEGHCYVERNNTDWDIVICTDGEKDPREDWEFIEP